jgi:hypothetical protein
MVVQAMLLEHWRWEQKTPASQRCPQGARGRRQSSQGDVSFDCRISAQVGATANFAMVPKFEESAKINDNGELDTLEDHVNVVPVPPPVRRINGKGTAVLNARRAGNRAKREGSRLLQFWFKAPNTNSEIGSIRLTRARARPRNWREAGYNWVKAPNINSEIGTTLSRACARGRPALSTNMASNI